jgi:hypothetical protein
MGQNGILSQTRKISETISHIHDDASITSNNYEFDNDKRIDDKHVDASDCAELPMMDLTLVNLSSNIDDRDRTSCEQTLSTVIETIDNTYLFTPLNIVHQKTCETAGIVNKHVSLDYADCIEDISNDGNDFSTSSLIIVERTTSSIPT